MLIANVGTYMLRKIISSLVFFFCFTTFLKANDISGFWMTLNKKTKKPTSVVAVYSYENKYYARIIATYNEEGLLTDSIYNPKNKAHAVKGSPYFCGFDIVFDAMLGCKGKYKGFVIDPTKGKVYKAELWKNGENLILRGHLFIFRRTEVGVPFPEELFNNDFQKPDLTTFIPKIYKIKN